MRHRYLGRKFAASIVAFSSIFTVNFAPVANAAVDTCTWTGTGGDNKFSTASNWSGCDNGSVPEAGDTIKISHSAVSDNLLLTNDLNVSLGGVVLEHSAVTSDPYKSVALSSLRLAGGATVGDNGAAGKNLRLVIGTSTSTLDSYTNLVSDGDLHLETDNISYKNLLAAGIVTIGKTGDTVYYDYRQGDQMTKLVILEDSQASFWGQDATEVTVNVPLELNGGLNASIGFSAKCAGYGNYGCTTYSPTNWVLTGAITVNAETKIDTGTLTTVYFAGSVNNKALLVNGNNAAGEFKFGTPATAAPSQKETIQLEGDQKTVSNTVTINQIAVLSGARSSVTVYGELKGTGTIENMLMVEATGKVAPGMSPGCLTTGILSLRGEYVFELGGSDPCSGYDQIKVTDATGQSVSINQSSAVLTTSRWNGYTPTQGQVFTIIDNQGSDAVLGTFKDLPEGATFEQNGVVFKISYVGGTGNDVTLTVQNIPTAPDTGFALLTANPILSLIAAVAGAGALMLLARRVRA